MNRHLLLAVAVLACVAICEAGAAVKAPVYVIDLDAAPQDRWSQVISEYQEPIKAVLDEIDMLIPKWALDILVPIFDKVDKYLPSYYPEELTGVASTMGVEVGKVVAMNLIYDLSAFCTSIVAADSTGKMYHSRNLDYPIKHLRNITVQVDFRRNNQTVYECTTFAGYVGCLTGIRPDGFSLSVDERDVPGESILDNLLAILKGGKSLGFLLRSTLENTTTYNDALKQLSTEPLIAPVYIILAGANNFEGAVVTRNRSDAANVWTLQESQYKWFVLETNFDHWKPAGDHRRETALAAMSKLSPASLSNPALYGVLSTPPVQNSGTKYTCQMIPSTGSVTTYIRWDDPNIKDEASLGLFHSRLSFAPEHMDTFVDSLLQVL